LLHRDPLHGTGHWFLYIKALCKAMVINFLVASRPSTRQWSSISYIKALSFGMVIDFLCHIETLSVGLVIHSITSRPSTKQWSLISWLHRAPLQGNGYRFLYIGTLCLGMVESTHKISKKKSSKTWKHIKKISKWGKIKNNNNIISKKNLKKKR